MLIDKKELQNLQSLKIKHDLDEFPFPSNYLYIDENKCLFISKFKNKLYQVYCTPQCNLSYLNSQSLFNVLFTSNVLQDCIDYWKNKVKEII